jgi:RNA polymerase sigma factor (sigma-70 family)
VEPAGLCAAPIIPPVFPAPAPESLFPATSTVDLSGGLPAPSPTAPNFADFGGLCEALFELHRPWAESIGRSVKRGLPPSFDIDDLEQEARIQHWRCVGVFDPGRGVPYRAFAYFAIRGAVLMSCRRGHYREATHEPLIGVHLDGRGAPDELLIRRQERRNVAGPREYRQRVKLRVALASLPAEDSDLVRQVLAGADVVELERSAPGTRTRLSRAVYRLKRELKRLPQPQRMTDPPRCELAAQLSPEELRAAIACLPPADAYLVRRVHLDGQSVAALAAVWGVEASQLETRLREALAAVQSNR